MANILITGANGFIGSRLAATMPVGATLRLNGTLHTVGRLTLVDHVVTDNTAGPEGAEWVEGDLGGLVANHPDLFSAADAVFHLASATSGECEADLDLGLNANLMNGIALGRCLAAAKRQPLLVFSSTLAIYGGTPEAPSARDHRCRPRHPTKQLWRAEADAGSVFRRPGAARADHRTDITADDRQRAARPPERGCQLVPVRYDP